MKHRIATCSRRTVLKLAASSALVTTMSALSIGCGRKVDLKRIAQRMIATLNHPDKARELGSLYLAETPGMEKLSVEALTAQVLEILKLDPRAMADESLDALDARLREQVRRDFVNEDVVTLRGWMLSRTELLLCALAATYT